MWTGEIYFLAKEAGIPQFIILMTFAAHKTLSVAGALLAGLFLSSCSSQQQVEAPARLPAYHFVPGKTAVLHNGKAIPPQKCPFAGQARHCGGQFPGQQAVPAGRGAQEAS